MFGTYEGISQLGCNDNINMAAGEDCMGINQLTPEMLLEGDPEGTFVISDLEEMYNPNPFVQQYKATVSSTTSSASCWGYVFVEDKRDPIWSCQNLAVCELAGAPALPAPNVVDYDGAGYPDPFCVRRCYERKIVEEDYFFNVRNSIVPEDVGAFVDKVVENCQTYDESNINYYDTWLDLGCGGERLERTWVFSFDRFDGSIGSLSCSRYYVFTPLNLATAIVPTIPETPIDPDDRLGELNLPAKVVNIPTCDISIDPASIQAFFDDPSTTDEDTDNDRVDPDEIGGIDCVVENNEGTPFAYPYYFVAGRPTGNHPQAITAETCNLIVAYQDQMTDACAPGCSGNSKTIRNWTVLDWCSGDFIVYEQIIKVVDDIEPTISLNPDDRELTVSVDPWKCSADVLLPAPEHLSDACDPNLSYRVKASNGYTVTGSAATGYVIRDVPVTTGVIVTYEAEDCCGNIGTTRLTLSVADNTPPVAVTKEFIVTGLTGIGNPVQGFDNGISKVFAVDIDNGSYDGCTDVTVHVRRDTTCNVEDGEWGEYVSFCCADLDGAEFKEIDVEIRVMDAAGNSNISWSTVRLEDKAGGVFCPDPMIVTCDMDLNNFTMTGIPIGFTSCGPAELNLDSLDIMSQTTYRDKTATTPPLYFEKDDDGNPIGPPIAVPAYNPSCGFGAVRRRFRDANNTRSVYCDQWFVVEPIDNFDSGSIIFPDDVIVDCDDYETGEPTFEESVCNLVGVSLESDTFLFEEGACFKILNKWSVIDWCVYDPTNPALGGRYESVQEIKLIDTVDPVLSVPDSLCYAVNQECTSKGVVLTGGASDNGDCGSEWIAWEVVIDAFSDWTPDYTFSSRVPQLIDGEPNPLYIPKSANGEDISIVLPDGIEGSKVWHRAVWRAYDGCNNNASVTRYFQIADKKAPTPYCLNLSSAVMENGQVELWAIDFNVGSFDNCSDQSNLLFTFTDVPPPPRCDEEYDRDDWYDGTFWYYNSEELEDDADDNDCGVTGFGEYDDQDGYGDEIHRWEPGLRSSGKIFTADDADANGFAQVPIYVWDECGNIDFCLVNLRIVDNMGGGSARISGSIATEYGETVENVMTMLTGPVNISEMSMTDASGQFAFENIPMFTDYNVQAEKNDDYLNGISTLDIILMQKHILRQEMLETPYQMIAADIDGDKNITAIDLIELRKLILGITSEFSNNGSWKFVDASLPLTTANPWLYREQRSIEDFQDDMLTEDFIGVKIGDLNYSLTLGLTDTEIESRSSETIEIDYADRYVEEGELIELTLETGRDDVYGYQFTLESAGLELVSVRGENIDDSNVASHGNRVTMSHGQLSAIESGELVTMTFKTSVSGQLSDIIRLSSDITNTEAYVGAGLEQVAITMRGSEAEGTFALHQNEPNPFTLETTIGFDLPESGTATLTLHDVTGKVLNVIQGDYAQGYNEIKVGRRDINTTGLVYYTLQTANNTATQHMVVID